MSPLDARRAHDIGDVCARLFAGIASGIEGFAGDPTGLHPKGKSPTREAGDAPNQSNNQHYRNQSILDGKTQ